jgi:stage V sporulation protein G
LGDQGRSAMDVTEIRVYPVDDEKLKAFVTITLDNCFVVRDLKVIKGISGLFVAMPSRKMKDGSFKDMAHPLNNETRKMIENKVLDEYYRFMRGEAKLGG